MIWINNKSSKSRTNGNRNKKKMKILNKMTMKMMKIWIKMTRAFKINIKDIRGKMQKSLGIKIKEREKNLKVNS